jgi:GNAT superfamily N-acetyltransferase
MSDEKNIQILEELTANAWRPEYSQILDGWHIGYSRGVTGRGNSVFPIGDFGRYSLDEKISLAEEYYKRLNHYPTFKITRSSQPAELESELVKRGYTPRDLTEVQISNADETMDNTISVLPCPARIEPQLTNEWFNFYVESSGYSDLSIEVRRGVLERISTVKGFAMVEIEAELAAVGLGVIERGWLGIYCMATTTDQRRMGGGTQVLNSLAEWGLTQGADKMYLQVEADNDPAKRLYSRAGFEFLYNYQYWKKSK